MIVLDDFFPDLRTGFRIAEFNWYLRHGMVASVATTADLAALRAPYAERFPEFADTVRPYALDDLSATDLAYTVFLNNAHHHLDDLEATGTRFVVTLYPGGGLDLGDPSAEERLERVLSSPSLGGVITTQRRVTRRVLESLPDNRVAEIIGVVVDPSYHLPGAGTRQNYYPGGKDSLDLAFVGHRYSTGGRDKGLDVFLDTVRLLTDLPVVAHVVGGFTTDDLPIDGIEDRVRIHGVLPTRELRELMFGMDLVVSPNRAGVLSPYAFDGFPTGSAVEASLCGAGMVVTDPLDQNIHYVHGRDVLLTAADPAEIADEVRRTLRAPGGVQRLARAGLRVSRRVYGVDAQLWPRARFLASVKRMGDE